MTKNDFTYDKDNSFYFCGIGGIGMSGLAKILALSGYKVSGSDSKDSEIIRSLEKIGIKFYSPQKSENIKGRPVFVYSAAIPEDNPEYLEAKKKRLKMVSRSELLGDLMSLKKGIAVAGTHGKTTVSTMLSLILEAAKLDPTIVIGGEVRNIGGNSKKGEGEYFVAEACEYRKSFLDLHPFAAIITNIEADHLDSFLGLEEIVDSFKKFISQVSPRGFLVVSSDCEKSLEASKRYRGNLITYGIKNHPDYYAQNISVKDRKTFFDVYYEKDFLGRFSLLIPGVHNVMNALAVIALSRSLGIETKIIKEVLSKFTGAKRRFEIKGEKDGILVIDDYGHHPTEIKATLKGLKEYYPHHRLWCVFQPHQYSRTRLLLDEFSQSFSDANYVIIPDIYEARDSEEDKKAVSSEILTKEINKHSKNAKYIPSFEDCAKYLSQNTKKGDIILTIGAGPVYEVGELFLKRQ